MKTAGNQSARGGAVCINTETFGGQVTQLGDYIFLLLGKQTDNHVWNCACRASCSFSWEDTREEKGPQVHRCREAQGVRAPSVRAHHQGCRRLQGAQRCVSGCAQEGTGGCRLRCGEKQQPHQAGHRGFWLFQAQQEGGHRGGQAQREESCAAKPKKAAGAAKKSKKATGVATPKKTAKTTLKVKPTTGGKKLAKSPKKVKTAKPKAAKSPVKAKVHKPKVAEPKTVKPKKAIPKK